MKYVVVCYSVHCLNIASIDIFDNAKDAVDFLEKDTKNTYEEEISQMPDEDIEDTDDVGFRIDDEYAHVWHHSCDCDWTWHIIEVA